MLTLTFRRADLADVPAVVALVESTYRGEASRIGWTTEADLLDGRRTDADEVRSCIEVPRSCVVLGFHGADLVACANVRAEGDAGYFGMFSVVPSLQRAGIGKDVLAEAERIARDDWELSTMRMTVIDVRDELIAYYERRGYRRTGNKKRFPYGEERFGIPRRDDLRFEVLEKQLVPQAIATRAAQELGTIVVLKGHVTYIASPDGECFVNKAGNLGLGTSGSGDTLAGVIAGLGARGATPMQAAAWGVHVHAKAGDVLSRTIAPLGYLARELLDEIPRLVGGYSKPRASARRT